MILGHMAIGKYPLYVIWSFHMPFFFIIDGYFWKDIEIKSGAHRKLTIRLLRRLIVPYVLTCILTIFLVLVIDTFRGVDLIPDLRKWILAALYGHGSFSNKTIGNVYPIGGLWFLWALFWGKLLFSYVSNKKNCLPVVIFLFWIGYAFSRYVYLPLSFNSGLTCIIFIYLGRKIKEFDLLNKNPLIIIPTLVEVWGIMLISGAGLGMSRNYYANIPSNIICGITGTLLLLYFSKAISRFFLFKAVKFIGQHSLLFLCLHITDLNCLSWIWLENVINHRVIYIVMLFIIRLVLYFAITMFIIKIRYFLEYRNEFIKNRNA